MVSLSSTPKNASAPWMWRGYRPSPWQAFLSVSSAVAAIAGLWYVAPPTQGSLVSQLYVALHEASHAVTAYLTGGTSFRLVIEDGGGHVVSSGGNRLLISAAGPLLPAWLSAAMLALGVCRRLNSLCLAFVAVAMSLVAWLGETDQGTRLGLSAWAVIATFGALWPLGGLSRSILVLVFAIAIAIGVFSSFSGLWHPGHPDQPSDIAQVASELGISSIRYVAKTFAVLIVAGYSFAILYVANWLHRHRR